MENIVLLTSRGRIFSETKDLEMLDCFRRYIATGIVSI